MSHYPDLSPYSYDESPRAMLNVGWLHPQHGYATGVVDERVVQALVILSSAYENQMRGFHRCEFCDTDRVSVSGGPNGDTRVWLGSAEIRVTGEDGTIYAAPNLVIHYITAHRYRPPEGFCRAAVGTAGIDAPGPLSLVD
ncbi:hypothetical protein PV749_16820 [Streptomyces sp. ID03-2B]|uniref:DUF7919 family protein n=1 Tax=Streptomyces sp. ID03-2B TaxID=3028660 RepID=UPI0029BAD145|nr:hypothetical protein [Streptomyces sp. ID03-2B]MDX3592781.1 hypothetical protein [Streptomyces sp. ID03-2B]